MSIETIGLVISIISLALGLLSSWQQIKSFLLRAIKCGSHAAKSWALKEQSLIKLYLDRPSALAAYLGKSAVSIFLLLIALLLMRPAALQYTFGLPSEFYKVLFLMPACLIGLILGSISSRCSDVIRLASRDGSTVSVE